MSDRGLKGKVVLITGASSGIGAATAVEFARHGARLSLTGRNEVNLQQVADDCSQHLIQAGQSERPLTIVADLEIEDDIRRIVDKTIENFGGLDILVNNAGMTDIDSIEQPSLEVFDRQMRVNLRSVYQLTALAVPHLIEAKGNIVNVSSFAGSRVVRQTGHLSYSMSKAALDQLTRCIAMELAEKGVRVNSVAPGYISGTQIARNLPVFAKQQQKSTTSPYPMKRCGEPNEVARVIAFLASDDASYVTGDQIFVDGGTNTRPLMPTE